MTVNWNMALAPDTGTDIYNAFQQGQQQAEKRNGQNALSAYAQNPTETNLNLLAQYQPEYVIKQRESQAAKAQEQLKTIAKLFDGVSDQATYQQRLSMASRMGIDVTDAPPNFDPGWVAENGAIFKFLADKPEALSTFGKQAVDEGYQPGTPQFNERVKDIAAAEARKTIPVSPGGAVAVYDSQTGKTSFAVMPNNGDAPAGSPAGSAPTSGIARPASKMEYDALPPGAQYYDPDGVLRTKGGGSGNATGGFLSFKKAIISQESGGRYGVPNAQGSGAMGIGQVMPETAKVLAQRAGLPWRPDLMGGTTSEAMAYQDRITEEALKEAWNYGGGDIRKAAQYYFGGSDTGKWGPKTRQYGTDIMRRMGVR